jgi:hypothetical protein
MRVWFAVSYPFYRFPSIGSCPCAMMDNTNPTLLMVMLMLVPRGRCVSLWAWMGNALASSVLLLTKSGEKMALVDCMDPSNANDCAMSYPRDSWIGPLAIDTNEVDGIRI